MDILERFGSIAGTPRHRCSVSVDCLPLLEVRQSVFPYSKLQGIARAMLVRNITPEIAPGFVPPMWRSARSWGQLWRIPRLVLLQDVDSSPSPNVRRATITLSSNQLFLGLIKSPRPAHLVSTPGRPEHVLDLELSLVRQQLDRLCGEHFSARDMGL
jgi:hypothetical protein